VKRRRHPQKPGDQSISELAAQIEAQLSGGSRAALQRLLAKLAAANDESEEGLEEPYGSDDFDETSYRGLRPGPYGEEGPEDSEDLDETEPYWWRRSQDRPAAPLPPEAGLYARNQRGQIGETWWSRRFLQAVESALVGGRLARGRTYARRGQVVELDVGPGLISARVQGSRPTPYKVQVAMPVVPGELWERILLSLAGRASYCAGMLAGELPPEVEDVFAEAGVPLLPSPTSRLSTACTCPDWANPCKHVAAVCYLVAEQFDLDPFAVLAWRGRDRAAVLGRLRELRGGNSSRPPDLPAAPAISVPPLPECLAAFWDAGPELASVQIRPVASGAAGAVLRQLPRGLLEVRGKDVGEILEVAYQEMATAAQRRALGSGN
jgi:uncharacterized Zn finger protein